MAKATKAEANYRIGEGPERCANCTMFRPPSACTAVKGKIAPEMLCDYFEPFQAPSALAVLGVRRG